MDHNDAKRIEDGLRVIAGALEDCFVTNDGNIADAIYSLSHQLKYLGNGDAATSMGAIEAFGKHIGEKLETLSSALGEIAGAVGKE